MKISACFAIGWILVVSVSQAQDPVALKQLDDELLAQKAKFRGSIDECQKFALTGFDREIAAVKSSKNSAAVKLEMIGKLQVARDEFDKKGTWPDGEDFLKLQYDFAANLHRTYMPVSKAYGKLFEACLKANNFELAKSYKKDKAEFDDQLPGRSNIKEGAKFRGIRSMKGEPNANVRLTILSVTDSTFEAKYEIGPDTPSHNVIKMEGTIDGISFVMAGTKAIVGPPSDGKPLIGYVTDGRILLTKTVAPKGKSQTRYFHFSKF